jgi:hypothetical protein
VTNGKESERPDFSSMSIEEISEYYLEATSRPSEVPLGDEWLDEDGALQDAALPAAYLDTSAVIDYWWTEGADIPRRPPLRDSKTLIQQFLSAELRTKRATRGFDTMVKVRDTLLVPGSDLLLVTSPVALLELQSYMSESNMRYWLHEAVGAEAVDRRGAKDIGDILRSCWDEHHAADGEWRNALGGLQSDGILEPSYVDHHGLWGVYVANIRRLDLTVSQFWETAIWLMAYLQVGTADVLHTCVAQHLGCQYFVSFDGDFKRVRKQMKEQLDLELVCSPQALLDALRRHPATKKRRGE